MKMQLDERSAAAHWLSSAQREYRAAADYSNMAVALLSLDAPVEMVARTQRAGATALHHHEQCGEIASLLAHPTQTEAVRSHRMEGRAPTSTLPALSGFKTTAVNAFQTGIVGEAFSINWMRRSNAKADPKIGAMLQSQIVEDQLHLGLSRDVVAWCVENEAGTIVDLHNTARRMSRANLTADVANLPEASDIWKESVLEATWWLTTTVS